MQAEVERNGLGYAWGSDHCPAVNAGPEKDVGHSPPGELTTKRGELLHMDFGVSSADYCSDLQRVWYFLDEGETAPPDDVARAWDALWASMDAGGAVLEAGVEGWEVDAAARKSLVAAGYPEPMYALGHQLGRSAHDGGTVLAPKWDRYGAAPLGIVEEGNVFTLEYGTPVPGRGYIGLEEDVVVTARRDRVALDAAARALARLLLDARPLNERRRDPGRIGRLVERCSVGVGHVDDLAAELAPQIAEHDSRVARVALRLEAVSVVGSVVAAFEEPDALLDRRASELEPALVRVERALGRIAVTDPMVKRVGRGDNHGVLGECRELLDPRQPLGMTAREVRVALDDLRSDDPASPSSRLPRSGGS